MSMHKNVTLTRGRALAAVGAKTQASEVNANPVLLLLPVACTLAGKSDKKRRRGQ
jgi:hypothetical protein